METHHSNITNSLAQLSKKKRWAYHIVSIYKLFHSFTFFPCCLSSSDFYITCFVSRFVIGQLDSSVLLPSYAKGMLATKNERNKDFNLIQLFQFLIKLWKKPFHIVTTWLLCFESERKSKKTWLDKFTLYKFNGVFPILSGPWHFYIATVQTGEATLVRSCVTGGFVAHNLNGENEASLAEAIFNNA